MKEIKAYIRQIALYAVIGELERVGARDFASVHVDVFGAQADPAVDAHHLLRKYGVHYSSAAKLEIVCPDAEVDRFIEIIRRLAHTGAHGDGRIFISDVSEAINVRTGAMGEAAL